MSLLVLLCLAAPRASAQRYALINGRWFDGRTFVPRTVYVDGGTFVARRPSAIDSTIDLAGALRISASSATASC